MNIQTPAAVASRLDNSAVMNDFMSCRQLLTQVMTLGVNHKLDMSPLLPSMIKLLAHSDLVIKKTACQFLTQIPQQKHESILLAVNTLLKDCEDSNPMVRGLALQTLCSMKHEAFSDHCIKAVQRGLDDRSAYVRRTSVMSCIALHKSSDSVLIDAGFIDKLYSMIRDSDPIVTVNSLMVLEEVLKSEGGVVLSRSMVNYLLNKLAALTPWGVAQVLNLMLKYQPKTEDEIFDIMNVLDIFLQHNSVAVATSALQVFLHLVKDMPHLCQEIFKRFVDSVTGILGSGSVEVTQILLEFIDQYRSEAKTALSPHYKLFFCRHRDPAYLKRKKLDLLSTVVDEDNLKEILDEITMNCTNSNQEVSLCAIEALGKLSLELSDSEACLQKFEQLLNAENEHVLSNTLKVMVKIGLKSFRDKGQLMGTICAVSQTVTDPQGKCAILHLIGQYGYENQDCPYALEEFIENFQEETSQEVKVHLLLATLKLFCDRPAECQGMLGNLLEQCMSDCDQDLKDQAVLYYGLLETNIDLVKAAFSDEV